ncbi:hypothetical protein CEQ90_13705 [Lewinellaceae bacterium SD302]|nr:hypothetical protein CEQ90_13705 [Lewinellaceae bacterium SD302]
MRHLPLYFLLLLTSGTLLTQVDPGIIEWNYVPLNEVNGGCISFTDCDNSLICYAVTYTPTVTANLVDYNFSFSGDCDATGINVPVNASCVLFDNSFVNDFCVASGIFQIGSFANAGPPIALTENTPIVLHQICFDLSVSGPLDVITSPLVPVPHTVNITLPNGTNTTDHPTFAGETATVDACVEVPDCSMSDICSVSFATNGPLTFPVNNQGAINDGFSEGNSQAVSFNFDVYNEIFGDCTQPGGEDDITITTELITTYDVNGNAFLNELAGTDHRIIQNLNGLNGLLPFNINQASSSSAGDVRGYRIRVDFADHIGVRAEQLTVNLGSVNSGDDVFESAVLRFLNNAREPYSEIDYLGYFNGPNDLSGNCLTTLPENSYTVAGAGAIVFNNSNSVDLTDPCDPVPGVDNPPVNPSVNAATNASLAPVSVVRGFVLEVYGEDVAAPAFLDDGSGSGPDDGQVANAQTASMALASSDLFGYTIDGCVFELIPLPVTWLGFNATKIDQGVQLRWQITEEVNHDRYSVEWSRDGRSYQTIANVYNDLPNSSPEEQRYAFTHQQPEKGTNYYRIRQHDVDGTTSLSVVRRVDFSVDGQDLVLFPNPASGPLTLLLGDVLLQEEKLEIYSSAGFIVRSVFLEYGTEKVTLDITGLQPGLYFIRVGQETVRFLKT